MTFHPRVAVPILFAVLVAACGSSDWGTPEYFEGKVGVKFTPAEPVIRCEQETGPDYIAFSLVRLPAAAIEAIRRDPSAISSLPAQRDDERDRKIQHWTRGPLSDEAGQALSLALDAAATAVRQSRCPQITPQQVRDSVMASLARDATLHAYQFKPVAGGTRVLPEALDFWVLDPSEGVLYELVNHS